MLAQFLAWCSSGGLFYGQKLEVCIGEGEEVADLRWLVNEKIKDDGCPTSIYLPNRVIWFMANFWSNHSYVFVPQCLFQMPLMGPRMPSLERALFLDSNWRPLLWYANKNIVQRWRFEQLWRVQKWNSPTAKIETIVQRSLNIFKLFDLKNETLCSK